MQVARQATAEQNWSAAAQAWADVLRQQPRSLEAWLGSGLALYQTQRFEQALQAYQRALAVDPRSEAARQGWWTVLARVDPPQASLALQSWLEEHASDAAAWRALGQAQARLRRWADASQAWERALALDAQRADVWANLGVALDHLKRHAQAASAYEQALRWPMPEASRRQIEQRLAALRRALSDPQGEDTP
ncbi:MAG: tetratricopeptide repeat protein [Tepidimonas sp.]|uniref:tetratricopeptide repeat protein n=1 Tax=Tepidimonas sp. TaxID=2002775 RepID=UPI004054F1FE